MRGVSAPRDEGWTRHGGLELHGCKVGEKSVPGSPGVRAREGFATGSAARHDVDAGGLRAAGGRERPTAGRERAAAGRGEKNSGQGEDDLTRELADRVRREASALLESTDPGVPGLRPGECQIFRV